MNTVIRPRSVAALAALGVLTVSGVASAGSAVLNPASVPDTTSASVGHGRDVGHGRR